MKRYYFKKNEKEMKRLKKDLAFYGKLQRYVFQSEESEEGYVCQFKKSDSTQKSITMVIRNSLSNAITIQIGCINWVADGKLIDAFFPELKSTSMEEQSVTLLDKKEKEIRHDIKLMAKVRLGSYFNQREDAE